MKTVKMNDYDDNVDVTKITDNRRHKTTFTSMMMMMRMMMMMTTIGI